VLSAFKLCKLTQGIIDLAKDASVPVGKLWLGVSEINEIEIQVGQGT
jgi:hypothetical protein